MSISPWIQLGRHQEAGEPNHAGDAGGASIWFHVDSAALGPDTVHLQSPIAISQSDAR